MTAWGAGDETPVSGPRGLIGWIRVIRRTVPLAILVFGGLALLLLLRLVERPVFGAQRPWTPHITVGVCRGALRILGLPRQQIGVPDPQAGALVANHSSWLDIFVLNAGHPLYFVAKAEVSAWPGIGWLARATGTLFIRRNRSEARAHVDQFRHRLRAGHLLTFFPEGTSTDGLQVLPFKPTLFASFFDPALGQDVLIQPVSVIFHAAPGEDARQYGWWGDMDFAPHLLSTLAAKQQGRVEVIYHPSVSVQKAGGRKALAETLQKAVAAGVEKARD